MLFRSDLPDDPGVDATSDLKMDRMVPELERLGNQGSGCLAGMNGRHGLSRIHRERLFTEYCANPSGLGEVDPHRGMGNTPRRNDRNIRCNCPGWCLNRWALVRYWHVPFVTEAAKCLLGDVTDRDQLDALNLPAGSGMGACDSASSNDCDTKCGLFAHRWLKTDHDRDRALLNTPETVNSEWVPVRPRDLPAPGPVRRDVRGTGFGAVQSGSHPGQPPWQRSRGASPSGGGTQSRHP